MEYVLDRIEGAYGILVNENETKDIPLSEFKDEVVVGASYALIESQWTLLNLNAKKKESLESRMAKLKRKN